MAHRLGSSNDTDRHTSGDDDPETGPVGRVGRRAYVKLGATGILAALFGAGRVGAADGSDAVPSASEKRILIRPHSGVTRYEITVDGRLRPGDGTARDAAARISGTSAEGIVAEEDRRYKFSGELRDLSVTGDAAVYVGTDRIGPA